MGKKMWLRVLALTAVMLLGSAVIGGASVGDAARGRTVMTQGTEQFVPNAKIMATLHFSPGPIVIHSGETLTLKHADQTQDPHTLSIVNADEVPADIEAVFGCGEPGTPCGDVFGLIGDDEDPPRVINGPGTAPGLDGRLDTLIVFPGESVSAPVTASPGTTLSYICAIHAWMQGTVTVK
jgi:hypothetical protein